MIESFEGLTAGEPELCRVSIIGDNTQIDVGLPTTVPIAEFITDVVTLIDSRNPDLTEREDAPIETRHWTLARLGHEAIPPDSTLAEARVFDGELLVLRSVGAKTVPVLFDDVIDAVARLTQSSFRGWTAATARWAGLSVAMIAVPVAIVLLALSKDGRGGMVPGAVATATGVVAFVAAMIVARIFALAAVSTALSLYALLLLSSGVALLVPGAPGSPHALLGCAVLLVTAALGHRISRTGAMMFAAAVTVALFGGAAAAVMMTTHNPPGKVADGVAVAALIAISAAARLAVLASRLPVPPVPTAGGAIDPADHEPRPTIEGVGAIGATALASAMGLTERARAATEYQSGMLIGTTVAAVAAAVVTADAPSSHHWQGVALALVVAGILCLRGRAYADLVQAGTLVGGGCAAFLGTLIGLGLGDSSELVTAAAILLAMAAIAVGVGVAGPSIDMSPVTRRAGEIAEYVLIVAVIPLVLWSLDLYSAARNL